MKIINATDPFIDRNWVLRSIFDRAHNHIAILLFLAHRAQLELENCGVRLSGRRLVESMKPQIIWLPIWTRNLHRHKTKMPNKHVDFYSTFKKGSISPIAGI